MNKGLKIAMIASSIVSLTSPALAEEGESYKFKMKGKIRTFFGQVNSGVEGTSAYLTEFNEGNIAAEVKSGGVTGYFEIESREGAEAPTTIRRITYKMANGTQIGMGTFKPKWGYNFAWGAGTETSEAANYNIYKGLTNKLEGDGLDISAKIAGQKVGVTIYQDDRIHKDSGTTTQIGAMGKVAGIDYRVNSISAKSDDFQGGPTATSASSNVNFRYKADDFAISIDSANKSKGYAETSSSDADTGETTVSAAYNKLYTDMALQGRVKIGDDELVITLATETEKKDTASAKMTTKAHSDVVYIIPLAKKANLKLIYANKTTSLEDSTDPANSATFAGLGLFVKF